MSESSQQSELDKSLQEIKNRFQDTSVQDVFLNSNIKKQIIETGSLSNKLNSTVETEKLKQALIPVNNAALDLTDLISKRRKLFDKLMCDRGRLFALIKKYKERKNSFHEKMIENETENKVNKLINKINYMRRMNLILLAINMPDDCKAGGMDLLDLSEALTGDRTSQYYDLQLKDTTMSQVY